ncbi:hypothetical protein HK099_001954, partial [Clydaea vesicula]
CVPETQVCLIQHRIRTLRDGRKVALAEKVHEFLDWAQRYFEISICSLGDQPYVDMVVQVLDPSRNMIRGLTYSARGEYLHIQQTPYPKKPPKDLAAIYAFYNVDDVDKPSISPIIIDDNISMWPQCQQDNIIVVRESKPSPVWNVNLIPIQALLQSIHGEFFKQVDNWELLDSESKLISRPVVVDCYKDLLRKDLSIRIASNAGVFFDEEKEVELLFDSNGIPYNL